MDRRVTEDSGGVSGLKKRKIRPFGIALLPCGGRGLWNRGNDTCQRTRANNSYTGSISNSLGFANMLDGIGIISSHASGRRYLCVG